MKSYLTQVLLIYKQRVGLVVACRLSHYAAHDH